MLSGLGKIKKLSNTLEFEKIFIHQAQRAQRKSVMFNPVRAFLSSQQKGEKYFSLRPLRLAVKTVIQEAKLIQN
jgi:hypothetical protein